ncbi:hypothetical protein ACLUS2_012725 [Curtobacterium flaccumfaciens pv. flaccumfaciens]|uniref:hypothetical protein n=1 Tax=Curtobacterium flaccumfaciens TaxID=2035 RepID=UPI0039925321
MKKRNGMLAALAAVAVAAGIMVAPATAQAASLPAIKCTYRSGVTTCIVVANGGYCGSSRRVGLGVTTGKKGGIIIRAGGAGYAHWEKGKVKNHNVIVGTTYSGAVTIVGKLSSTEKPYVSCNL